MAKFYYNGKKYYMDDNLHAELKAKVIPDLRKKDMDVVWCVDGKERSGKSKFADLLGGFMASELGTKYDVTNICFTPEEFKERIINAKKNEVIIYDEAHRGMASRRALSPVNGMLNDLMMEMGQKNLCVIIVLPTFFMLDKYPALYRIRGLFHVYTRKGTRGFWVYFNEKTKLNLYLKGKKILNYDVVKWPPFRGRFYDQYVVDETAYRKKKAGSFNHVEEFSGQDKYMDQRDRLIFLVKSELKLSEHSTSALLNRYGIMIKHSNLGLIVRKLQERIKIPVNPVNSPIPKN